jgi:hypothetical protein
LSDEAQLWQSADGKRWQPLPASKPALTLFRTEQGIWSGGEHGAELLAL